MARTFGRISAILASCASLGVGEAGLPVPPDGNALVKLSLIAETDALVPGGTTMLGMHFEIAPKWHIYWDGMNDAGFPPSIEIIAPAGYKVGTPLWPAPVRHLAEGDILDHVYEREATVMVPVSTPSDAKPGASITLEARSKWLVCDEVCVPGEGHGELTMPVAAVCKPSAKAGAFASARARLPGPLPADGSVSCEVKAGRFTARSAGASGVRFFPASDCVGLNDLPRNGESRRDTLGIDLATKGEAVARVRGVLEVVPAEGVSRFYTIDMPAGGPPVTK